MDGPPSTSSSPKPGGKGRPPCKTRARADFWGKNTHVNAMVSRKDLPSIQSIDYGDEPRMKSHELIYKLISTPYFLIFSPNEIHKVPISCMVFPFVSPLNPVETTSALAAGPGPNEDAVTATASRGDACGGGGKGEM